MMNDNAEVVMEEPSKRERSPLYHQRGVGSHQQTTSRQQQPRGTGRRESSRGRQESRRRRRSSPPRRHEPRGRDHQQRGSSRQRRRPRTPSPESDRDDHANRDTSPHRRRRRQHSPSRNESDDAAAAVRSHHPAAPQQHHHSGHSDWICGICQSPNFSRRVECYKCSAPYDPSISREVEACDELIVRGIPHDTTESKLTQLIVQSVGSAHPAVTIKSVRIVRSGDGSSSSFGFVLLSSVAEAQKVVTATRGKLVISGGFVLRLSYSLRGGTVDSNPVVAPAKWEPPVFATDEEKRSFLLTLYDRWNDISQDEKSFYDKNVDLLIGSATQTGGSGNALRCTTSGLVVVESSAQPVTRASSGVDVAAKNDTEAANAGESSLSILKKKLELRKLEVEKKKAAEAAAAAAATTVAESSSAPSPTNDSSNAAQPSHASSTLLERSATHTIETPAQTLLQRLAEKKKAAAAHANAQVPSAIAHAAPAPAIILHGFPIPPHFPMKQFISSDIAGSPIAKPNLRSYVMLKFVPERLAQRLLADVGGVPVPPPPVLPTPTQPSAAL